MLDDPAWDRAALEAAIAAGKTRRGDLKKPVPVLLVYLTAIADPDGRGRFSRDIYDGDDAPRRARDGPLGLGGPAPRSAATAATRGKPGTAPL